MSISSRVDFVRRISNIKKFQNYQICGTPIRWCWNNKLVLFWLAQSNWTSIVPIYFRGSSKFFRGRQKDLISAKEMINCFFFSNWISACAPLKLNAMPWFHGKISREEAEKLLNAQKSPGELISNLSLVFILFVSI